MRALRSTIMPIFISVHCVSVTSILVGVGSIMKSWDLGFRDGELQMYQWAMCQVMRMEK